MRSIAILTLKLAGATAAFALLFHFVHIDPVLSALSAANTLLVCLGVLVFLSGQVVAAARWRKILQNDGVDIPLKRTLRMNLIGTFAGNFLPGMATGDLTKSALLFRDYPMQRSFLIASVVYDRIFGLAAIFILMIIGTLLLGAMRGEWGFARYAIMGGLLFLLSMWLIASDISYARILHILPKMLVKRISVFMGELQKLLRASTLRWRTLAFSLVFQLSWAVSQWIMLCALSANAPFVPVLTASTFSLVVALLPISLNGLGLREGTFSYVLQHLGVDPQIAVAATLLSLLPILVSSLIGGMLLGWGSRYGKVRATGSLEDGRRL
ncbi:MAG: hypothetical protein A3G87_08410 [Omnitrophica bacterium RIFCSPLOWO2_12_FULL_50_11]|nr:MAG: hypothetical protein A3G87_08410 [Omnitrophica bacterium RIFCSPLOWO2_12_FULL_50_11]